jgi:hypothetical protein
VSGEFTVDAFIRKWRATELKENSAAQEHFLDLCRILDEPTPAEADPAGEFYCFERGATKTSGGDGWADVWKRGHFGWEYKGKRKNLDAAFGQLQQYALALENPPILVVCDMDRFVIRTNWTNTVSEKHEFALEDLREPRTLQKLKWIMSDPEKLRPGKTRQDLTEDAAAEFATLAQSLRARGHATLAAGLLLVMVMGLGIMTTIGLIGTGGIAIQRGIAGALDSASRRYQAFLRILEVSSAVAILAIGLSPLAGTSQQ